MPSGDPLPAHLLRLDPALPCTSPLQLSPLELCFGGRSCIHALGRVVFHWVTIPYRILDVGASALAALLQEIPKRRAAEHPLVALRIGHAMAYHMFLELGSVLEPLLDGFGRLVRAKNCVDLSAAALYTRNKIHHDPFAASSLFPHYQMNGPVDVSPISGLCWGMSLWFISLYQSMRTQCPNHEERVRVVAKQFENGAPREAILLQAIGETNPIPTRLGTLYPNIRHLWHFLSVPLLEDFTALELEWQERPLVPLAGLTLHGSRKVSEDGSTFSRLENGCYLVRRINHEGSHEMVYIKVSETCGYTFDPVFGLSAHYGSDQGQQAQSRIKLPVKHINSDKLLRGAWVTKVS